jgi:soluble lytic murein transglycosylase
VLLDMGRAFERNDTQRLAALLPQVAGHPLEPLAGYWELSARLQSASHEEIRTFLRRWSGTFYENRLRTDWLIELGRNRNWGTFNQELPLWRPTSERELRCLILAAPGPRPLAERAAELAPLWLGQTRADEGCALAAQQLLASRALAPEVAWQRARLAAEGNQRAIATQAVRLVAPDRAADVAGILENPARFLAAPASAAHTRELATLALIRLAMNDPAAAAEQLGSVRWRTQLGPEEQSWVRGVIGRRLTQRLDADALEHFGRAQVEHLHDEHLIWKTRAALRGGNWGMVREAIMAMSPAQREQPAWSYWLARALIERARSAPAAQAVQMRQQAQDLYQRIAGVGSFYEQLALEALGQSITTPPAPAPLTLAEVAAARSNPGLQRALHAIAIGLRTEGVREWNYQTITHPPGGLSDRELLAAADFACSRQVWDRCISTSLRTRQEVDQRQRFPMPFREQVVQRSREIGLDPAYVFGLIHQESRFVMDARSHVGASGLMQVMPATARWTARQIGLRDFQPEQINDRDTNIVIGTAYLKLALENFDGVRVLAAAAYNAGAGRPRLWRNGPVLEAAIWIENIPFAETRDYVQRVLANSTNYAALISGQPQRLSDHLPPIGPRAANAGNAASAPSATTTAARP